MYTITKTEKGYSLVEVLIAISILMLAIVGPLTIAAKSIQTAQYARQQTTAFFLAQEGITAVNIIRNEYALVAYNTPGPGPDPWVWTTPPAGDSNSALPFNCFPTAGNPYGCGIDFRDVTLLNNNDFICTVATSVINPCRMRIRTSAANTASLYTHNIAGGLPTAYTRAIKLTRQGTDEVLVSVEVSWNTTYLGGTTQSVVLQTSLFNIYEDL